MRVRHLLCAGAVVLAGCGGSSSGPPPTKSGHLPSRTRLIAVGEPVPRRAVGVLGAAGTLELRAADPARSHAPALFAILIRPVAREPRDVCFGIYAGNERPADGDVHCQVRSRDPLVSIVAEAAVPGRPRASFAPYVVGQVASDVARVELVGGRGTETLVLSADRIFLARFASTARGPIRVVVQLRNGHRFTRAFDLPLSGREAGGTGARYRRPGAVFNDEVAGNIVGQSYRQIVRRFGAPLKTQGGPGGDRCAYYDVVGSPTGWLFCVKQGTIVSASGNQAPPAGVH